jgi:hypothetical protein
VYHKWDKYIGKYIPRKRGDEPMFKLISITKQDKKHMKYGYIECPYCHEVKELRLDVCELPSRSCGCIWKENISKYSRDENTVYQEFNGKRFYKTNNGYWKSAKGLWMHRYVWEISNGVNLADGYEIHHIDRNRDNNSPNNLIALSVHEHRILHAKNHNTCKMVG